MEACDDRDAGRHDGAKTFEHGRRGLWIETRHWLIREDDRRVLRERAGDRDALLLPAGELIRARVRAVQQADRVEAAQRELTIGAGEPTHQHPPRRHPRQPADEDVLDRGQAPDEIELLEDQRDIAARPAQCVTLADLATVDADRAVIRRGEAGEATEQRRLAGAARTEHGDEFSGAHRERHSGEGGDVGWISLRQRGRADHRAVARRSRYSSLRRSHALV